MQIHNIHSNVVIPFYRLSRLLGRLEATCCGANGSSKCLRVQGKKCPRQKSMNVLLQSTGQVFCCLHVMHASNSVFFREIQGVDQLPPELSGAFFSEKLLLLEEQRTDA